MAGVSETLWSLDWSLEALGPHGPDSRNVAVTAPPETNTG